MLLRNVQMPLATPEKSQDPAAIDRAARKLEGAFASLLIHSMRSSGLGEDAMFPGAASQYRDVYDQQLAHIITEGRGLGLQEAIRRQLSVMSDAVSSTDSSTGTPASGLPMIDAPAVSMPLKTLPSTLEALPLHLRLQSMTGETAPRSLHSQRNAAVNNIASNSGSERSPAEFVAAIMPHAQKAAAELGVPVKTLIAQAALETGWGRKMPRQSGGSEAHNLFGIKATGRWTGDSVTATTTEVVNGTARREVARFRAYDSAADSFNDYVRLLKTNPRYADSLNSGGDGKRFAQSLQRAGYATDPDYAAKLHAIAEGPTMRRAIERVAALADTSSPRV